MSISIKLILLLLSFNCFAQIDESKLSQHLGQYKLNFDFMMGQRGFNNYKSDEPTLEMLKELPRNFGDSTAILFYHHHQDTLHSWLVADQLYYGFHKIKVEQLQELENNLRILIGSGGLGAVRGGSTENLNESGLDRVKVLKALNLALFPKDIKKGLKSIDKIIIVPALNISTIPFYLLDPIEKGEFLIEKYTISMAHGLQHLFENSWRGNQKIEFSKINYTLLGFSKFNGCFGLNDLPGVEKEINAADSIILDFNVKVNNRINWSSKSIDPNASKDELLAMIKGSKSSSKRIIYISSHAASNPLNPLDSNYIFINGCEKITERELQTIDHSKVLLTILSACQTGNGMAMSAGTLSVSRAFLKGNAMNVVSSLWNVDDHATYLFMSLFLQELNSIQTFENAEFYPAIQLRNAMLKFRELDQDPHHWAAFISMGYPITQLEFW